MFFSASFDRLTKVITIIVFLLFIPIFASQFFFEGKIIGMLITSVLYFSIILFSWGYHPASYVIEGGALVIIRPFGNKKIDRIKSVKAVPQGAMTGTVRTAGVGGLFGYFGYFSNSNIGRMTWYATQGTNYVVVESENTNRKIVVTPDSQDKFIEAIKTIIK